MSSLIGLEPNQLVINGNLGGMAYQDPEAVNIVGGLIGSRTVDQINAALDASAGGQTLGTMASQNADAVNITGGNIGTLTVGDIDGHPGSGGDCTCTGDTICSWIHERR